MTKRTFMAIITVDDGAFDGKGMSATSEVGMAIDYGLDERMGFLVTDISEIIDNSPSALTEDNIRHRVRDEPSPRPLCPPPSPSLH